MSAGPHLKSSGNSIEESETRLSGSRDQCLDERSTSYQMLCEVIAADDTSVGSI